MFLVGYNSRSDCGTVVTTPPHQHYTHFWDTTIGLEGIFDVLGNDLEVVIGLFYLGVGIGVGSEKVLVDDLDGGRLNAEPGVHYWKFEFG